VTVSSCLALRRPPRPALFPYTTLFRSFREGSRFRKREVFRQGQALAFWDGTVLGISTATDQCANRVARFPAARFARPAVDPFDEIGRAHVNSSHVKISYAVFCLKKKK